MAKDCKPCDLPNTDPLYNKGTCSDDSTVADVEVPNTECCPETEQCSPWEISESNDTCVIDGYIAESINIGGAVVNVHKLLGVHEQGLLQDLTGNGTGISNGDHPNFPASQAFDRLVTEWKSLQVGDAVKTSAYIGYDFGEIRLDNGRLRYGSETFVKKDITTIKFRQGCNAENRATKVRIERSDNNDKWFGVALVDVEDCDGIVTLNFNRTVPSRFWRMRVIDFNGGDTDHWAVQSMQLIDYEATNISNIQDRLFLENRNRDYEEYALRLKGSYQPVESQTFLSKFGFDGLLNGDQLFLEMSFSSIVTRLGRPFVIGDIVQLPSETQYSPTLRPILKYMEVTDVSWAAGGYSPTWQPIIQRMIIQPVTASEETQDLFGPLTQSYDELKTSNVDNGMFGGAFQDIANIDQYINAEQNTQVPVKGTDYADVAKLSEEAHEWAKEHPNLDLSKIDRVRHRYGIDGMPPNGEPYTEGDSFPSNPQDRDYHRLTYDGIATGIFARLHRYSSVKSKWLYMESDGRAPMKSNSIMQQLVDPETSTVTKLNQIDDEV